MTSARATGTERLERQPRQIDPLTADKSAAELDDHHVHRYTSSRRYLIAEGVDSLDQTGAGRYDVICTPIPYHNRDSSQVRLSVRLHDS
ncbi:hypothetical protein [Halocatena marina]|uniref:hypothetical protein n=1 Tax=Halocatena marina TaxID=2934937 RepID=UPI00200EA0E6|nr:hypothetical protein [Halocatena marina]